MRLVLFGAGAFGVPTFDRLADTHKVVGVYTQPARPAGRRRRPTPTPVAGWAASRGLPCVETPNANADGVVAGVRDHAADAGVVIAFGQKLSPQLIAACGRLAVNLHSSLLPAYRGAAPIHWAVLNGDARTGVSVIGLAPRMDAGEIYARVATPIDPQETTGELHDRLAGDLGPDAVADVLRRLADGTLQSVVQDEAAATRARKLTKADGTTDFGGSAAVVRAWVHGVNPWPGCRVAWRRADDGGNAPPRDLRLLRVRVADAGPGGDPRAGAAGLVDRNRHVICGGGGRLELLEVQRPGGRPMPFTAFADGNGFGEGDRLTKWTATNDR